MPESKRFLLRLDPDLFEALRRWADDDLRSINAQIEYLLTDQARRAGRLPAKRTRPPRPTADETSPPAGVGELEELEEGQARKRHPRTRSSA
ncbi:MAG TPA: hypothetical protein VEF89_13280 [Solirubrobacteraceae bacterium]|nr:hypothetical protein [Solirubrobacteraceae bacterium]